MRESEFSEQRRYGPVSEGTPAFVTACIDQAVNQRAPLDPQASRLAAGTALMTVEFHLPQSKVVMRKVSQDCLRELIRGWRPKPPRCRKRQIRDLASCLSSCKIASPTADDFLGLASAVIALCNHSAGETCGGYGESQNCEGGSVATNFSLYGGQLINALLCPGNSPRLGVSRQLKIAKLIGFLNSEVAHPHSAKGGKLASPDGLPKAFNDVVAISEDGHRDISGSLRLHPLRDYFGNCSIKPSTRPPPGNPGEPRYRSPPCGG